jgi:hypothetical protein
MRNGHFVVALAVLTACANAARADDDAPKSANVDPFYRLDTKNLFGSLEGADVGDAGDRSVEFETTGAFFKSAGHYAVVEQELIYEITPDPRLGVEFGAHAFGQSIGGAPGGAGYSGVDFSGLSNEWRYVLLPRAGAWSVQATVTATPQWARVFEGGAHGQDFTLPLLFILEAQPIERRLYADLNLTYAPEVSHVTSQPWSEATTLTASGALSYRITPAAMLGAETDFYSDFAGLAAQSWRGAALFLGPTFHYQITDKIDLSGAWTEQIAHRAPSHAGAPDLADFTRSEAKLRLEVEF